MAGNFRGVLIFVIFAVDLAVTKFFHPQKLMPKLCKSMMMGAATNIVAAPIIMDLQRGQYFPVLASNSIHCHPADSVFDTNNNNYYSISCYLSKYAWLSNKEDRKRDRALVSINLCSATPLYCLLSQNLKSQKLILRAFSDFPRKLVPTKITRHTVFRTQLLWYYHKCLI